MTESDARGLWQWMPAPGSDVYGQAEAGEPFTGEYPAEPTTLAARVRAFAAVPRERPFRPAPGARIWAKSSADGEWQEITNGVPVTQISGFVLHEDEVGGEPFTIACDEGESGRTYFSTVDGETLARYFITVFAHAAECMRLAFEESIGDEGSGVDLSALPAADVYTPRGKGGIVMRSPNAGRRSGEFTLPPEVKKQLVNPKDIMRPDEGIYAADRHCMFCGHRAMMILPIAGVELYESGIFAQEAFPDTPKEIREVVISGTHPKCWDENMRDLDEDE